MNISPAKENILKKIRQALSNSTPLPFPQSEGNNSVFKPATQEAEVEFAEQFTRLQGRFVYCLNAEEVVLAIQQLAAQQEWKKLYCVEPALTSLLSASNIKWLNHPDELATCDAAITGCEMLVARTGSIVMSSGQISGRTTSVYAPVHVCIAYTSQLVYDIKDALLRMKEQYGTNLPSFITLATGPSRTADIEKTLVVGVHGPKEVYVFLLEGEAPPK